MDLEVHTAPAPDGAWIVRARGEIDLHTGTLLEEELDALLGRSLHRLVIDLSEVVYMDSSGLRILLGAQRRAGEGGGALALAGRSERVLKVLLLTGMLETLPCHATVAEALEALSTR